MVTAAREKANTSVQLFSQPTTTADPECSRVARLEDEHKNLKLRFEHAKSSGQQRTRDELFASSSSSHYASSSTTHATQRKTTNPNGPPSPLHESPFAHSGTGPSAREDFALREHTFLQESENSLDTYIAQGRAVLTDLVEQRGLLKGTKRKLLDAANTLGLSRETIGWVERRT